MKDEYDGPNGLFDDDPALDYILFEEMKKENMRSGNNHGCLSMVAMLLLPVAGVYFLVQLI